MSGWLGRTSPWPSAFSAPGRARPSPWGWRTWTSWRGRWRPSSPWSRGRGAFRPPGPPPQAPPPPGLLPQAGPPGPGAGGGVAGGGGGPKAPSRPQVLASGRGPFLTLPLVITKDPETGELNLGMYRMQVLDPRSTAMHWQLHKVGRRHLEKAKRLGRKLEVAVALGGDPVLTYAATAPLPPLPGVSEFHLAGFLRGPPLSSPGGDRGPPRARRGGVRPRGLHRPRGAPGGGGAFWRPHGLLHPRGPLPPLPRHRRHPPQGGHLPRHPRRGPPMEDAYLIEATERLFLPALRLVLPEVVDYHMPPEGWPTTG